VRTTARLIAVAVAVAGCAALTACGDGGTSSPRTDTAQSTRPAAPASAGGSPATGGPSATSESIDPCALLTPSDAAAVLHKPLGAGRKVTTSDLNECAYGDGGLLIVAVLKGSFTKDSFQQMIKRQNSGPYAETAGKAAPVAGLGDAAYSFEKVNIVEVLQGSTVISITSGNTETSKAIARAVLVHLP
jgi:hypothetical protein